MRILGLFTLISLLLIACKDSKQQAPVMEKIGDINYQIIKKTNGKKLNFGDYVYFNGVIAKPSGEIINKTNSKNLPVLQLVENPSERGKVMNDVFAKMSVGDSVHIFFDKQPPSMPDSVVYRLGIVKSLTADEFDLTRYKKEDLEASKVIGKKVASIYSDIKSNKLADKIQETASGLKYIIHKPGTGAKIKSGEEATVNYYGILDRDGKMFDNSWRAGKAFTFPVGQGRVIKGWDEGLALLKKGTHATLIIPSELGYGERGSGPTILPGDDLIFYIEVQ